jgi:hypothetical protein
MESPAVAGPFLAVLLEIPANELAAKLQAQDRSSQAIVDIKHNLDLLAVCTESGPLRISWHCVVSTRPNVPTQHILKETDVGSPDGDADSEAGAMLLQAFEHVVPGVQYALQTYPTDEQVVTVWRRAIA